MDFLTKTAAGITRLVDAITTSSGVSDAGKIAKTNSLGKIDSSFIDFPSLPIPRSWTWTVYEPRVGGNQNQFGLRFNGVLSTDSRFRSPFPATITNAVSSTQDNDDFNIEIYINGALDSSYNHPTNTSTVLHTPNVVITNTDEIYIRFLRVGGGSVDDVTFEMHLLENV